MRLVPFSAEHLRVQAPLPFGVRDATGRLLLHAGASVRNDEQLLYLRGLSLFADENESNEWRRRLGAQVGAMMRRNATLGAIADARPADEAQAGADAGDDVPSQWEGLAGMLHVALRDAAPHPDVVAMRDAAPQQGVGALRNARHADFVARVRLVRARASALGQRHADASLYHLIHLAGQSADLYSSHHALLVMLVCEQAAEVLGWTADMTQSLGCAALSMNVAMATLQDQLALSDSPPTPAMREQIRLHPEQGAQWLHDAGLDDALWCEAVRLHHERGDADEPLATLPAGLQLARLLRRADIFTAKVSRRRARAPMSPVQAAREACLGAGGVPDDVGGALLRATGLYPPGSFVELANGERGIVVARGRRANLPWVASLVSASGMALGEPALRDTLQPRYTVRAAIAAAQVKVRPDHRRILALR